MPYDARYGALDEASLSLVQAWDAGTACYCLRGTVPVLEAREEGLVERAVPVTVNICHGPEVVEDPEALWDEDGEVRARGILRAAVEMGLMAGILRLG